MFKKRIYTSIGLIGSLALSASVISCNDNPMETKLPTSSIAKANWASSQDVENLVGSKVYGNLEDGYPARIGQSVGSLQPISAKVNALIGIFYYVFASQYSNIDENAPFISWRENNTKNNDLNSFLAGRKTGGQNNLRLLNPHWEIKNQKAFYVFSPISKNYDYRRKNPNFGKTVLPNNTVMYAGLNYEGLPVKNPFPFNKEALKKITRHKTFQDAWFSADSRNKTDEIRMEDESNWKKYKSKVVSWFRDEDQTFHIPFSELLNFKIQHSGQIPNIESFYQEKEDIPTPEYLKSLQWKVGKFSVADIGS